MDDRNIPVTLDLVGKNPPDQSISDALQELGRLRTILSELTDRSREELARWPVGDAP